MPLIEIVPVAQMLAPWGAALTLEPGLMPDEKRYASIAVHEMRTMYLRLAEDFEQHAAASEELARVHEEAGITGIHPSVSTLRDRAQRARDQAAECREAAAKILA